MVPLWMTSKNPSESIMSVICCLREKKNRVPNNYCRLQCNSWKRRPLSLEMNLHENATWRIFPGTALYEMQRWPRVSRVVNRLNLGRRLLIQTYRQ